MGKTILTPEQRLVLDFASKDELIYSWFYLTGGTALAEFHLHHRLSEDLDFFSDMPFPISQVDNFVKKTSFQLGATNTKQSIIGHGIYTLKFKNKSRLKLDFVHQPFKQLEAGVRYNHIRIASLWDIVVDKLYTIFHRVVARDFVDLYFGIQAVDCDLDQLIAAMEEKYGVGFDRLSILSRLPIVKDLKDYPTMIVPFDPKKMEDYFLKMTKELEGELFY